MKQILPWLVITLSLVLWFTVGEPMAISMKVRDGVALTNNSN